MLDTKVQKVEFRDETKKCPGCAEEVKVEARTCRFCRYQFLDAPAPADGTAGGVGTMLGGGTVTFGRWIVMEKALGFGVGTEVRLSRTGNTLTVESAEGSIALSAARMRSYQGRRGQLLIVGEFQGISLYPREGQDPTLTALGLAPQ